MNSCAYGIAGRVTTAIATRHHCGAALRTRWTRGGVAVHGIPALTNSPRAAEARCRVGVAASAST